MNLRRFRYLVIRLALGIQVCSILSGWTHGSDISHVGLRAKPEGGRGTGASSRESATTEFTLPNGMRWIVSRSDQAGMSLLLYLDAGTAQETPGKTGMAACLTELWRSLEERQRQAGATETRTFFNPDRIISQASLPTAALAEWMSLQAGWLSHPPVSDFGKARAAAETARDKVIRNNVIMDELRGVAFRVHPYRIPSFGFPGELDRLSSGDATDFLGAYLVPKNLIGVAVGNLEAESIKQLAERYFGSIPGEREPKTMPTAEPEQAAERRVLFKGTSAKYVLVGSHAVAIGDEEAPAWGVAERILRQRLEDRLTSKQRLAEKLLLSPFPGMKYPRLSLIIAQLPRDADVARVRDVIIEEMEGLVTRPPSSDELAAVRALGGSEIEKLSDAQFAVELADWAAMSGDWRTLFRYPERVAKVTEDQVLATAKRVLRPTNRTIVTMAYGDATP